MQALVEQAGAASSAGRHRREYSIAFLLAPLIDADRLVAGEAAAGQLMEYVRARRRKL